MNNIGKVVLETYGGLQQGSHARQAFDLFTQRVHAKRRFENLLGADASKEAFDNADSAVTAAKADPDLKPQLYAMEENATKWQRALEKEITKPYPMMFPNAEQMAEHMVASAFVYAIRKIYEKENSQSQTPQGK